MTTSSAPSTSPASPVAQALLGTLSGNAHALITGHRPDLLPGIAAFVAAVFDDAADPQLHSLSRSVRLAVAARTAWLESDDAALDELLAELPTEVGRLITAPTASSELSAAPRWLRAIARHIDLLVLRPGAASPDDLDGLLAAGFDAADIVLISQIISFVGFFVRLRAAAQAITEAAAAPTTAGSTAACEGVSATADQIPALSELAFVAHPAADRGEIIADRAQRFTAEPLVWHAWVSPLEPARATDEQQAALAASAWPKSPYFRLLAWHPASLTTRTTIDETIFLSEGGLPRGERELAAAVTSRLNGCRLCASVHSRFAEKLTGRVDEVQRLLAEGVEFDTDARWRAIVNAVAALQAGAEVLEGQHIQALRAQGLSDGEAFDALAAAAFFTWANRLMLSLGSPRPPAAADADALADQQRKDAEA